MQRRPDLDDPAAVGRVVEGEAASLSVTPSGNGGRGSRGDLPASEVEIFLRGRAAEHANRSAPRGLRAKSTTDRATWPP
jgi:hypothetical protein